MRRSIHWNSASEQFGHWPGGPTQPLLGPEWAQNLNIKGWSFGPPILGPEWAQNLIVFGPHDPCTGAYTPV